MPESTIPYTKRDGMIIFSDAGAVNTYTVEFEPGDLSVTVPGTATTAILDRGSQTNVVLRKGDDAPCELSFSCYLRELGSADHATLLDIATYREGSYVADNWVSTGETEVFTVDVTVIYSGAAFGAADEEAVFGKCEVRANYSDGDPSTVSVTITSHVNQPTIL